MDIVKTVLDLGFTTAFAVGVLVFVLKFMPQLIKEWARFTTAIQKNTEVSEKQYGETIDLKTQLLDLKKQLEKHDSEKNEMREDISKSIDQNEEILKILGEMMEIVRGKSSS